MFGLLRKKKSADGDMPLNRRRSQNVKDSLPVKPNVADVSTAPKNGRVRGVAKHILHFLIAFALTAVVVLLGIAGYQHATTSKYFEFSQVEISGNDRLPDEEILTAAGLTMGQNIFSTDVVSARNSLLKNSWIEEAEVVRRLPGSIIIRVVERRARALVNLDVLYLVDDMGKVFKRWVRGDPIPAPMITGISREEYIQSASAVEAFLCDAIDLADRYGSEGLDRTSPLQEIYREPDAGFSLTVGEDPTYVKFGKGPYKKKLRRLADLLRRLADENKRPGQIFFDNEIRPDRITVKLKPENMGKGKPDDEIQQDEIKKIVSKI